METHNYGYFLKSTGISYIIAAADFVDKDSIKITKSLPKYITVILNLILFNYYVILTAAQDSSRKVGKNTEFYHAYKTHGIFYLYFQTPCYLHTIRTLMSHA